MHRVNFFILSAIKAFMACEPMKISEIRGEIRFYIDLIVTYTRSVMLTRWLSCQFSLIFYQTDRVTLAAGLSFCLHKLCKRVR